MPTEPAFTTQTWPRPSIVTSRYGPSISTPVSVPYEVALPSTKCVTASSPTIQVLPSAACAAA